MIEYVLILGLAIYGGTEVVKNLLAELVFVRRVLPSVLKVFISMAATVGAVALDADGLVLLGLAGLGMALVVHAVKKALDAIGEIRRVEALTRMSGALRRS